MRWLLISLLLLAGCGPTPEELARQRVEIDKQLPAGCSLHDAGRYNYITVLVVMCDGKTVSSNLQWEVRHGKSSELVQALVVQVK